MTLLLVLASPEYLRFFDTTVGLLVERGHQVHVVFGEAAEYKPVGMSGAGALPLSSVTVVPPARTFWGDTAVAYRAVVDFLRFLHPDFAAAPILRERIRRKVVPAACQWISHLRGLSTTTLDRVLGVLRAGEQAMPVDPRVTQTLAAIRPDLVVVSPLVDAASSQVDWVKGAQRAGIPAAVAVASWDNLTNKGLMRIAPERVFVWNESQRGEAVRYHAVPAGSVVTTGAAVFDRWFERRPSSSRDAFCRAAGLADEQPFVLFTGSSAFIADGQDEVQFVRRWIAALRHAPDAAVRNLRVVVRPHPYNTAAWATADLEDAAAIVWPRGAFNPSSDDGRRDFFDSLHHAAAVVGINTSAMIEAAIVGRPVLTVAAFATQHGTLHFQYLLRRHGGPVSHATTLVEHVTQLAGVLADPAAEARAARGFVHAFVRPQGLEHASAPRLAQAIEEAATLRVAPRGAGAALLLRPAVAGFGAWVAFVARVTSPEPFAPVRKQILHPLRVVRRRLGRQADRLHERAVRTARLAANRVRRGEHVVRAAGRLAPAAWRRCRRAVRHGRYALGMLRRGESPARPGKP